MGRATRVRSRWKQRSDRSIAPSVSGSSSEIQPAPVPKGEFAPDIVVVLSDGASNTGPQPLEAALRSEHRSERKRLKLRDPARASAERRICSGYRRSAERWGEQHGSAAAGSSAPIGASLRA